MLADLLTWWTQQIRDVVPRGWFARARFENAVVLRPVGAHVSATLRRRGRETGIGTVEPGRPMLPDLRNRRAGPMVLSLPPSVLLQQDASLPLAAEHDLGAVLVHEMDRLTPFRAADLFWTWRLQKRDPAAGRLLVRLSLVPKVTVAGSLRALEAAGLKPTAIEVAVPGGVEHLPFAPFGKPVQTNMASRFAAGLCATLIVALVAIPVLRQERAIAEAEDEVAALRPRIATVDALRLRIAATSSGSDLFAVERAHVGNPLRALAAVTNALPDDTYLTAFAMRQLTLSLAGRSAAAVKLIGLLAADPELRDPAFDAPVTRTISGVGQTAAQTDLFSIRVGLAP